MFNKTEKINQEPKFDHTEDKTKIFSDKLIGLKELFYNAKDPLAVLLQEMDNDLLKATVSAELLESVKEKLNNLTFKNEDEFAAKVVEAASPIWEITQKNQENVSERRDQKMFSQEDLKNTVEVIRATGVKKVYIVGNVGSGKSTFARGLSAETGFKNIDLDHFFQIFRQEQGKEAKLEELLKFVINKEQPPYIINHADLLRQGLIDEADCLILLSPDIKEQLKSRETRVSKGADGEWQNVNISDYEKINKNNEYNFKGILGTVKYNNIKTGTIVKVLDKRR